MSGQINKAKQNKDDFKEKIKTYAILETKGEKTSHNWKRTGSQIRICQFESKLRILVDHRS